MDLAELVLSKEKLTILGMCLVLIILYIFMDMVKDGDKKFMCILLLVACEV